MAALSEVTSSSLGWIPLCSAPSQPYLRVSPAALNPYKGLIFSVLFSSVTSVTQSCPTICNPMDCSMPGFSVHHQLPEPAQTHFHRVGDAIQPSHPLSSPSPPAFNLSQHQGLFKCQFFTSGGQSTGVSASASILPMNIQD